MRVELYSNSQSPELNEAVSDFVSCKIWGQPGLFGPHCSMAIFDGEKVIAGIVYHNYQTREGTVEISAGASSRRWMSRKVINTVLSVPFERLGCQAVLARHAENRSDLRHIWTSLGGLEYVVPRLRGRDNPAEVITVLTEEAWKTSRFMNAREGVE